MYERSLDSWDIAQLKDVIKLADQFAGEELLDILLDDMIEFTNEKIQYYCDEIYDLAYEDGRKEGYDRGYEDAEYDADLAEY